VPFNLTDLTALFMGRRLFDFLRGTMLEESLDKVYNTIETRLDREKDLVRSQDLARKVYMVSEGPKKLSATHQENLDEVLSGLLEERLLDVTYENAQGERSRFKLEPYSLVAFRRGLYVIGRIHESRSIRTFALERMHKVTALRGTHFDYPADFDPEGYFDGAFFIRPGKPEKVELSFTAGTQRFIRIRQFHKSQRMKKRADGRVGMTLQVPVTDEVMYWVLTFGANVKVESPASLREMVHKQLTDAAKQYG
jgi:proteasome accessory factor B